VGPGRAWDAVAGRYGIGGVCWPVGHTVLPGSAAWFGGSSAIRFDIVISAFDAGQLTGNAALCFGTAFFQHRVRRAGRRARRGNVVAACGRVAATTCVLLSSRLAPDGLNGRHNGAATVADRHEGSSVNEDRANRSHSRAINSCMI
jgi:hypothetical protein